MATYVVGDIHGCYNEWMVLKRNIENKDTNAKFILIGDIIDRGDGTYEMIRWAMKHISIDGKYQMIMGNHEMMKIDWWNSCCKPFFDEKGIEITDDVEQINKSDILIDNYGYIYPFLENNKGFATIQKTIDWFKTLVYYKDVTINNRRFIIAHGNVTKDVVDIKNNCIKDELNREDIDNILWDRYPGPFKEIKGVTLIHGHTPTILNEAYDYRVEAKDRHYGRIHHGVNRINIDCGIAYKQYRDTANLAALRLEDLAEFYVFE